MATADGGVAGLASPMPAAVVGEAASSRAGARSAHPMAPRTFAKPPARDVERARIGYHQVRISSKPDAVRSVERGRLDRGDEVEDPQFVRRVPRDPDTGRNHGYRFFATPSSARSGSRRPDFSIRRARVLLAGTTKVPIVLANRRTDERASLLYVRVTHRETDHSTTLREAAGPQAGRSSDRHTVAAGCARRVPGVGPRGHLPGQRQPDRAIGLARIGHHRRRTSRSPSSTRTTSARHRPRSGCT